MAHLELISLCSKRKRSSFTLVTMDVQYCLPQFQRLFFEFMFFRVLLCVYFSPSHTTLFIVYSAEAADEIILLV